MALRKPLELWFQTPFITRLFLDKVSKLFLLDYGFKVPSQDIKMKKGFIVYNIFSSNTNKKTRI